MVDDEKRRKRCDEDLRKDFKPRFLVWDMYLKSSQKYE